MRRMPFFGLVVGFVLLFQNPAWSQKERALIPRKAYFAEPDKQQVTLSTDGKWVGYRAPAGGTVNLWVAPVDKPNDAHAVTQQTDAPVIDYSWTNRSGFLLYR